MRNPKTIQLVAIAGALAGATILMSAPASADVACNRYGDCWHVSHRYTFYPPDLGITFYDDEWREHHLHDTHYVWRLDRDDDHGYYLKGEWHLFDADHEHD